MKKLFAVLALVGVMASCKDKKKEEKTPDGTTTTTTTDPNSTTTTTTTTTTSMAGVPTFSDPEVQQYVNDYTAFVNACVSAYSSKDITEISQMSSKMSDWSARSITIGQKLATHPEEATKFSNYITDLSKRLSNAMMPVAK